MATTRRAREMFQRGSTCALVDVVLYDEVTRSLNISPVLFPNFAKLVMTDPVLFFRTDFGSNLIKQIQFSKHKSWEEHTSKSNSHSILRVGSQM